MPLVNAYSEVEHPHRPNGPHAWLTDFIRRPENKSLDTPMAFLSEGSAQRFVRPHFHEVDQFQVIYSGSGAMGKHPVRPGMVHFARAYTPYGPISYSDNGLSFLTLRAHRDSGAQYLPEARPALDEIVNRTPWQTTATPDFDIDLGELDAVMKPVESLKNADGLAAFSLKIKPRAKAYAPDPSKGEGQYILVLKGGIVYRGMVKNELTVIWIDKNEGPFEIVAGPEGMEGLILTFPVAGRRSIAEEIKPASSDAGGELKTWQCILCAFVYDESEGLPEAGIAPGTRWADVPESFGCPDCAAKKADFQMIEF